MCRGLDGTRAGVLVTRTTLSVLVVLLLWSWCAPSAMAHTKLESTAPAAGSTSSSPVTEVTLRFTLPVDPLGDGVVIDGPSGTVAADVMASEGGVVLVATPSAPLTDGEYTVSWTAAAQDGHPLEGAFGFSVTGSSPSPSPSKPGGGTSTPSDGATTTPEVGRDHDMSGMDHDMGRDPAAMNSPATNAAQVVARLGGAGALWGGLVAAGGLVFAGFVLRGRDEVDVPIVLRVVRWSGLLAFGGLVVRVLAGSVLVAHGDLGAVVSPTAIGASLTGTALWDVGLHAVGGVMIATGARQTLSGSWLAVVGAVLVGAGQVLGGHSNTVEPRWLVVTADMVHLAGAATWVGGVVALGFLLRTRRRDGRDLDAALMGARFSVIAALSATAVGVAGVILAASILDRPGQLWESSWGLLLLAKIGTVVVVAVIGAYNHFYVVPRLTARRRVVVRHAGHSRRAGGELQRSAGREATLMVVIVLLTAWLVAASVQD